MDKGKFQEALATLFLRLNGYFTSGFIVHSPTASGNRTQVDVLAVRFPGHVQPDREVGPAPDLKCSEEELDIIIGEVKSKGEQLQFNAGLRGSTEAISNVLRWVGAFEEAEIGDLAEKVRLILKPQEIAMPNAPTVIGPRRTRIRGLLFSPEYDKRRENQPWFLHGPPIFDYLWRCLHPITPRPQCATEYDFGLWGSELEPIVRYIKASTKPATFKLLFEDFRKEAWKIGQPPQALKLE